MTILAVIALFALAIAGLAPGRQHLRGTTLMAAWCWAIGAIAMIAVVEIMAASASLAAGSPWLSFARYAAAMASFCPTMALLGAKRPQDRAWNWIVLSLWAVLLVPAIQAAMTRPGEPIRLHAMWTGFVLLLTLIGPVNGLPTRFWPSVLLVGVGQLGLVWDYLPLGAENFNSPLLGLAAFCAAVLIAAAGWPRQRPAENQVDQTWIDFRNMYGAIWGLRVAERFNQEAERNDLPVMLTWHGLVLKTGNDIEKYRLATTKTLRSLLLRFVSADWIDRRLGGEADANRL
jgi:uncharacterized membrane protein YhaH (DUF805 family)